MVGMSDQEKIGFLLCVIRNSDAKIPWNQVGEELELKPGTASKRLVYIRQGFEKENGEGTSTAKTTTPKKAVRAKAGGSAKKQKVGNGKAKAVEVDAGEDDDEDDSEVKVKTGMFILFSHIFFPFLSISLFSRVLGGIHLLISKFQDPSAVAVKPPRVSHPLSPKSLKKNPTSDQATTHSRLTIFRHLVSPGYTLYDR